MTARAEWTDERLASLREMAKTHTSGDVAHALGVSEGVLWRAAKKHGVTFKRGAPAWPEDRLEQLKALVAEGKSPTAIAGIMRGGLTRNAVTAKIGRLGLTRVKPAKLTAAPGLKAPRVKRAPSQNNGLRFRKAKPSAVRVASNGARTYPQPDAQALPTPTAIPLQCDPVRLVDARPQHCRWIVGEIDGPETLFCGAQRAVGSFCAAHGRIAYQVAPKPASARPERREGRAA